MALNNMTYLALRDLAATTSRAITAKSGGALTATQLQHDIKKENVGMSRQEYMDRMQAPGLQLQREQAEGELARRAKPVTLWDPMNAEADPSPCSV